MDLNCGGVLDDEPFETVPGRLRLSGTYRDGPTSRLSHGATCSRNDGYLDVVMDLPLLRGTLVMTEDDYYWQRWAAVLNQG